MQISRRVHPEVPKESALWADTQRVGGSDTGVGPAEGVPSGGGAPDGRPRAYDDIDTAEVFSGAGDGVHQRQDGDPYCEGVRGSEALFRGAAILGTRLLGLDGRPGRSGSAPIHPRAREGGPAT